MLVPNLQVLVVRFLTLYKLSEGSPWLLILTYFKAKERTWISIAYVRRRSVTRLKNVMLETEGKESNFGRQARLSNSAAVDVSWKSDLRERLELTRRNYKIQLAIGKKWGNVLFPYISICACASFCKEHSKILWIIIDHYTLLCTDRLTLRSISSSSRWSSVSFSVCWWCMKRLRTASSSCSSRRWISRFIACSLNKKESEAKKGYLPFTPTIPNWISMTASNV